MKKHFLVLCLSLSLMQPFKANAWSDGSGWANYGYLVKIFMENVKRYQQLRLMINQAKDSKNFMKTINSGINNAVGLLEVLPIKDEKILSDLKNFKLALDKINQLYGMIPKSDDELMQKLHDETIAESFKLANSLIQYAEKQEKNAVRIHRQSTAASPKGAARINAQTNAQILHSLNQLIKINGQMLKLQGESFAVMNKQGKDSSEGFNATKDNLKKSMKNFKTNSRLPKF
jgi:hypothetical protein